MGVALIRRMRDVRQPRLKLTGMPTQHSLPHGPKTEN